MKNITDERLATDAFATSFIECTLPKEQFDHHGHLQVAIWHLKQYPLAESHCRVRGAIIVFNSANQGENTGSVGYHETLTVFWLRVVKFFIEQCPNLSADETFQQLIATPLADKNLVSHFYDAETIRSPEARAFYREPNEEVNFSTELMRIFKSKSCL